MFKDLYSVLPTYGQIFLTVGIVGIGLLAAWRGFMDTLRKNNPAASSDTIPMWAMMGPLHETMQVIRQMGEQSRNQETLLREIDRTLISLDRGQQYTHYVLEAILRQHELMPPMPPPPKEYRR